MKNEFEMPYMEGLNFFLGLQIKQLDNGIFINQEKYCYNLLKRFGIDKTTSKPTPMSTSTHFDKVEKGKDFDQKLFRSIIGYLLYLTASRPNIMMSLCLCARFQAQPKNLHYLGFKYILCYLSGTSNYGLFYPKDSHFELVSYSNADFGGCRTDRKSTSDTYHFISQFHDSVKKQN